MSATLQEAERDTITPCHPNAAALHRCVVGEHGRILSAEGVRRACSRRCSSRSWPVTCSEASGSSFFHPLAHEQSEKSFRRGPYASHEARHGRSGELISRRQGPPRYPGRLWATCDWPAKRALGVCVCDSSKTKAQTSPVIGTRRSRPCGSPRALSCDSARFRLHAEGRMASMNEIASRRNGPSGR